jgi:hypothetical protein
MTPPNPDYPARLEIDYPEHLSRLLIFVKWLLAIPHFIAFIFLGIGAYICWIVSFFAVLITGRYPQGIFNYLTGVYRWGTRVSAYLMLMTDAYPAFSLEDDRNFPVRVSFDPPPDYKIARWRPLVHWLLVIPAGLIGGLIALAGGICVFLAWFAILITGRFPQGLFNVVEIALRWEIRVGLFQYWMTERYPPFVWA